MSRKDQTATVKSFKDLIVWQKSHQLFLDIAKDIQLFPKNRIAWVITDQIVKSSASISTNISEGFGRKTRADYEHFLIIARGSTTETQNWLLKCADLNYISKETLRLRDDDCIEILKMINSLIGSLRRKKTASLNP